MINDNRYDIDFKEHAHLFAQKYQFSIATQSRSFIECKTYPWFVDRYDDAGDSFNSFAPSIFFAASNVPNPIAENAPDHTILALNSRLAMIYKFVRTNTSLQDKRIDKNDGNSPDSSI